MLGIEPGAAGSGITMLSTYHCTALLTPIKKTFQKLKDLVKCFPSLAVFNWICPSPGFRVSWEHLGWILRPSVSQIATETDETESMVLIEFVIIPPVLFILARA